ncbi:MAG: fibrobacter succinogenes major paralogous domain-containing protein [Candidatus Peribacteria bacterium]|jgi:hypothetical protein|nr:fibrobacter succinogenes major paralogous domain-containing protein [Candidatus Peribacteria bacterium]
MGERNQLLITRASGSNVTLKDKDGYKYFNNMTAAEKFMNDLKLPIVGYRLYTSASLNVQGLVGYYWSSSPNSGEARALYLSSSYVFAHFGGYRAYGFTVRCFKDS